MEVKDKSKDIEIPRDPNRAIEAYITTNFSGFGPCIISFDLFHLLLAVHSTLLVQGEHCRRDTVKFC